MQGQLLVGYKNLTLMAILEVATDNFNNCLDSETIKMAPQKLLNVFGKFQLLHGTPQSWKETKK